MSLNSDPSRSKDPEGFTHLRLVIIMFTLTEVELSPAFSGLLVQISLPWAGYGSTLMEQKLDYSQPRLWYNCSPRRIPVFSTKSNIQPYFCNKHKPFQFYYNSYNKLPFQGKKEYVYGKRMRRYIEISYPFNCPIGGRRHAKVVHEVLQFFTLIDLVSDSLYID